MINDIYNLVQDFLNKNGRGIIPPARFVRSAKNVQLRIHSDIIEEIKVQRQKVQSYATDDRLSMLESVMEIFAEREVLSRSDGANVYAYHILPSDYASWGSATLDGVEISKVEARMKGAIERNYFISPTLSNPFCYIEGTKLYVLPTSVGVIYDGEDDIAVDEVELSYYRYPKDPNWTYVTMGGKSVFNESDSSYQDFELPYSQQNKLVMGMLLDLAPNMRDEIIMQFANQEEQKQYQKDNAR